MDLSAKLADLKDLYDPLDDLQERMALLVESAPARTRLPDAQRNEDTRVKACISAAWISGTLIDGRCQFRCAADSPLVSGLLACLCDFFSESAPEAVASSSLDPLVALGITKNLSPTRLNGLSQARQRIKEIAIELSKT